MTRTLFDNPAAHANDPPTSHDAARQHTASGRRKRHAEIVLQLVRREPGRTACELFAWATLGEQSVLGEQQEVRRRLTDLLHKALVRQGPARGCEVRNTKQITWFSCET